jgi:hypothetical protein
MRDVLEGQIATDVNGGVGQSRVLYFQLLTEETLRWIAAA